MRQAMGRFVKFDSRSKTSVNTSDPMLSPMSALMTSIAGLKGAQDRFETSARRIVSAGTQGADRLSAPAATSPSPTASADADASGGLEPARGAPPIGFAPDMASAMVDMMQAETSFKANAAVAGRITDMQKAYLDVLGQSGSRS